MVTTHGGANGDSNDDRNDSRNGDRNSKADGNANGNGAGGVRAAGGGADRVILAAGCVLWRPAPGGGGVELALVHRPKWQDWSHPKGKLKQREDARRAAVREVREETGMSCVLGAELPTVRYGVEGRPKQVRYWAAEAVGGEFAPGREVDRMVWLPPGRAREWVTQERDRGLVDALLLVLPGRFDER